MSSRKTVLVIGGTGPTGPYIVNGLIDRGYEVTILHSGMHEVEFKEQIEHIHTDPHFRETLEPALGQRNWDVVVFAYGRLRVAVEVFKHRTERMLAVGGATGSTAGADDARWGRLGRPANLREDNALMESDAVRNKFGWRMAEAEQALFAAHRAGYFQATYIAYPLVYGPRQPGPHDWCVVRRALDKRSRFILVDGGVRIDSRAFAENAAHGMLLAIDQPEVSSGQKYFIADENIYTMRQRIEAIAACMGHQFEFVDIPFEFAAPAHVYWRGYRESRIRDTSKARIELGYRDKVSPDDALAQTVEWLLANRPAPDSEAERQIGDPFDYAWEDEVMARWEALRASLPSDGTRLLPRAHMYRHPTAPGQAWMRPDERPQKADSDSN